jgi:hypothetical protein
MDSINQKITAMDQVMPTTEEIDRRIEELDLKRLKQLVTSVYANDSTPPRITTFNNIVTLTRTGRVLNDAYANDKVGMIIYLWSEGIEIPVDLTFGEPYNTVIKKFIVSMDPNMMLTPTLHKLLKSNKEYLMGFLMCHIVNNAVSALDDEFKPFVVATGPKGRSMAIIYVKDNVYKYFKDRNTIDLQCFYLKCPKLFLNYSASPC